MPFSTVSDFELTRRKEAGDSRAKHQLEKELLLRDVASLQVIAKLLLGAGFVVLAVAQYGWGNGLAIATVTVLFGVALVQRRVLGGPAQWLYKKIEAKLLQFVALVPWLFAVFRGRASSSQLHIHSREELIHVLHSSGQSLSKTEIARIETMLEVDSKTVADYMTPADAMVTVDSGELLGPLLLDELHKTGVDEIIVTEKDDQHTVGVLYLESLLSVDRKKSQTAKDAMQPGVSYIRGDQQLTDALAQCIAERQGILVVIDESSKTIGVITQAEIIAGLFGAEFAQSVS